MYNEQDFIQEAKEGYGFGHRGDCKYRVMDRQKIGATHHTNSLEDAKQWFHKCRDYWIEQDEIEKPSEEGFRGLT